MTPGTILTPLLLVLTIGLAVACREPEQRAMTDNVHVSGEYSAMDTPAALQVLFYPQRSASGPVPRGAENIDIEVEPDVRLGCRWYRASRDTAPVMLYFHGNGETVADYDDIAVEYTRRDMHLLLTTYRGYGWSGGRPTATAMMADAERLYQATRRLMAVRRLSGPLWLMGRSLGSASAIELAGIHDDDIGGLVIESGFADTLPLARTLGLSWVQGRMTEADGFRNAEKMSRVKAPTLILHGRQDSLIPPWHAEKLAAASAADDKSLLLFDGAGHNTIIAVGKSGYFEAIRRFVGEEHRTRKERTP